MSPTFVDPCTILDGWRHNRGVRGCLKTVLPLCKIMGLKKIRKAKNNLEKALKIKKNGK
jgi:hypothetical protein